MKTIEFKYNENDWPLILEFAGLPATPENIIKLERAIDDSVLEKIQDNINETLIGIAKDMASDDELMQQVDDTFQGMHRFADNYKDFITECDEDPDFAGGARRRNLDSSISSLEKKYRIYIKRLIRTLRGQQAGVHGDGTSVVKS